MSAMDRRGLPEPDRIADGEALMPPSGPARDLLDRAAVVARRARVRVAWVGGGVRDLLLGRDTIDTDLAIEGDAAAFAEDLAVELGGRVLGHRRFLTATIELDDGRTLDVASCRRETYAGPGALPLVEPAPLEEDLARRDFSINAVAVVLSPDGPRLLDPMRGLADLEAGCLRILHADSFRDDPTRILRGLRFEIRFGFRFEAETESWARRALERGALDTISGERLRRDWELACEAWSSLAVLFARAADLGLLAAIDPALDGDPEAFARIERAARIASEPAFERLGPVRWLVGVLGLDPPLEARLRLLGRLAIGGRVAAVLRASGSRVAASLALLRSDPPPAPHRVAGVLADASGEELCRIAAEDGFAASWVRRYLEELRPLSLRVRGEDLLVAGLPAGPGIGAALRATLEARQDGRIGAEQELEFARRVWRRGSAG